MLFTISPRAKKLEVRRFRAGRYFREGRSQVWVAKRLSVTTAAVCKWHALWEKEKEKGLKSKGRCGVKSPMTQEKLRAVVRTLDRGPLKSGFSNDVWTLERVRRVFKKDTGVEYHVGHVWKILTRTLGWSNQKPLRRARERNEAAIQRWITVQWPAIQKKGLKMAQR